MSPPQQELESNRLVKRQTLRRQVSDLLLADITSGRLRVGDKLPSIHVLSRRHNISTTPIRTAIHELEASGYLERRHGSGTYVQMTQPRLSMQRTVMLCIEARAHLYGELATLLAADLLGKGLLPAVVDTQHEEGRAARLAQALASDARFFIIRGEASLPFGQIAKASFPNRHFIGAISWETLTPFQNLHRVLSDYQGGGRLVAEHLWNAGHRRVLLVGTPSMIEAAANSASRSHQHGWGFARRWRELGGTQATLTSHWVPGDDVLLDEQGVVAAFRGTKAPTAIFGLRDLETWHTQTVLLRHAPKLADSIGLVGYGNTPWSQAGHPPFSTVDLDLPHIADQTLRMIEALLENQSPPDPPPLLPHLVLR
ncbi:MAG: GntR family transcriptional regulator [Lentisphaerae bacterium]|jgi:DNA-binding LacI/PurR family transcriptional regulator|nr:GntR family transcriptional regulator [Lentisphaerota bacterium]